MNIYVGNLSYRTTDDSLRQAFAQYGTVTTVNIVKDKFSGESRGFGFVEMSSKEEAMAALAGLNGASVDGRNINVNEARPRAEGEGGGGGGARRGGGGGDRGGDRGGRGGDRHSSGNRRF